jgi:hypothetical protein
MRGGTSRDGRQQSRLIRGNKDGFEICTVDHQKDGAIRLDATISYRGDNNEVGVYAHPDEARANDSKYFKVYAPSAGDALHPPDDGFIDYGPDGRLHVNEKVTMDTVAWWRMSCGRVLGMLNGMLVEYDPSTLAPLGLVVGADELIGKSIAVIDSGIDEDQCIIVEDEQGMEGADCSAAEEAREQAVVMYDEKDGSVTVVQPNEDGSYWRKIVRNKMVRMKEVRRMKAAKRFAQEVMGVEEDEATIVSSWGPYTTTSGTAKKTGVAGLTTPALR